jgi:hypothetical protein
VRLAALLLALGTSGAAAQQYTLALRPARDNLPNVMAALDPAAAIDRSQQSLNPFLYECVAFLQLRATDGTAAPLGEADPAVWVAPAGDLTKRRKPRIVSLRAGRRTLMVSLDPGDSRREFVVGVDSAAVADSSGTMVRALVSDAFTIPAGELEQCGRVPAVDVDLLAPDGEHPGFNVAIDAFWRRPLRLAGGGLIEIGFQGAATSAGESVLLNTLGVGGRVELKLNRGFEHWVSAGLVEGFETTERFDVVDLALGAAVRVRLDFLPVRQLRRLLRRFTPYPMLNLEYNLVDRLKGGGEPEVAGRPGTEHRLRGGVDWEVPMILGTTLRARFQADYLLSDVPAGTSRLRTVNDVTLAYPLGLADDVALVIQWLDGRAAPTYELASRWLLGLGVRR